METFLYKTAQKLLADYSEQGLRNLTLVFPGRRAAIFFADALASMISRPVWLPAQTSIDDLIRKLTRLETPHTLILTRVLWQVYTRHLPDARERDFDDFYEWGSLLLADFDTIDKYRINADRLYTNISDLDAIDERFADEDEAQQMIVEFWRSLKNRKGLEQEFLSNWAVMADIYKEFKTELLSQNLAYPGMIYRMAADRVEADPSLILDPSRGVKPNGSATLSTLKPGEVTSDEVKYVFIGFNALNPCEQAILGVLKQHDKAIFYWDADSYYLASRTQEAGHFLRRNIKKFGDGSLSVESNFVKQKQIRIVSTPSDLMQCKTLGKLLEGVDPTRRTAVILTDEALLPIVLRSIPAGLEGVNVTMGAPLTQSVAYVIFELLRTLQVNRTDAGYYFRDVLSLVAHPLVANAMPPAELARIRSTETLYFAPDEFEQALPLLRQIFSPTRLTPTTAGDYYIPLLEKLVVQTATSDNWDVIERNEYCYSLIVEIRNLDSLVHEDGERISMTMYNRLLTKMCRMAKVPIIGKPLEGLQIMGILESRCLDFDDIFILSLSDANFPGNKPPQSYIPPTLRKAYGLPTAEDHGAMWAYYFYRLLQRASRVTLLHSSATTDSTAAEPSRYLYQLMYESPHAVERLNVSLTPASATINAPMSIAKTPAILSKLAAKPITAWAINSYIDCPLRFYYQVVERIEPSKGVEEPLGPLDLGSIFHESAQIIYGKYATPEALKLLKITEIETTVDEVITRELGARLTNPSEAASVEHLKKLTIKYLRALIGCDILTSGLVAVQSVEGWREKPLTVNGLARRIGGKIDRVDLIAGGSQRVVDYKTGADKLKLRSVAELFDGEVSGRSRAALQMLLYAFVTDQPNVAIFSMPEIADGRTPETIDVSEYMPEFEEHLYALLLAIFDPAVSFNATPYVANCENCPFAQVCQRS